MATQKRFVLEGEWSGYSSSQRKVVHREMVSAKRAERLRALCLIRYSDGTTLDLHIREAKPREKIVALNGYGSLIRSAELAAIPHVNVRALQDSNT